MKKLIIAAFALTFSGTMLGAGVAEARGHYRHHRHQVCSFHHHHRVCRWV